LGELPPQSIIVSIRVGSGAPAPGCTDLVAHGLYLVPLSPAPAPTSGPFDTLLAAVNWGSSGAQHVLFCVLSLARGAGAPSRRRRITWQSPACWGSVLRLVAADGGPSRPPQVGLQLGLSRRSADGMRASAAAARPSRSGRASLGESLAARAEDVVRADAGGRQSSCSTERSSLTSTHDHDCALLGRSARTHAGPITPGPGARGRGARRRAKVRSRLVEARN
jgi:hypothetical protein